MRKLALAAALIAACAGARAQEDSGPGIQDNSFLVEEAYNQERGVVQHVVVFQRARGGGRVLAFEQEWPAPGVRHQLSYEVPLERLAPGDGGARGVGDARLSYRFGWIGDGTARLAVAPRVSALVPTGEPRDGLGTGAWGVEANLPASLVLGPRWVAHLNAGASWIPDAEDPAGRRDDLAAWTAGASAIWQPFRRFHFMLETAWERADGDDALVASPGVRFAIDRPGGLQIVGGLAAPRGIGPSGRAENAVLVYLSVEHGFRGPSGG